MSCISCVLQCCRPVLELSFQYFFCSFWLNITCHWHFNCIFLKKIHYSCKVISNQWITYTIHAAIWRCVQINWQYHTNPFTLSFTINGTTIQYHSIPFRFIRFKQNKTEHKLTIVLNFFFFGCWRLIYIHSFTATQISQSRSK